MERLQTAALVVLGFVVGMTLIPVAGIVAIGYGDCLVTPPDAFDADAWRRASRDSLCSHRRDMSNDLVANHLPVGMSRPEVIALLGEDERVAAWGNAAEYSVGCFIDCNWLVVQFDEDSKLARVFKAQD